MTKKQKIKSLKKGEKAYKKEKSHREAKLKSSDIQTTKDQKKNIERKEGSMKKKVASSYKVRSDKINLFGMKILKEDLIIRGSIALLTLCLVGSALYFQFWRDDKNSSEKLTKDEAKDKAEEFINENLLSEGMEASITEVTEEYDLYKLKIDIGTGQDIESYISKDGKTFFSSSMDIKEVEEQTKAASAESTPEASEVSEKSDKPEVELFVMSHCPYGTQIEKGIIPVVETLGNKIDFQLKFVDYAMHGEKELKEELTQYCINEKYPSQLIDYLNCFLEDETKSSACMNQIGINESKISSCVEDADKKFKITENYEDQSTWKGSYPPFDIYKDDNEKYGVGGSPTLVINGTKISSARDSASLLKTICSAFNNEPDECQKELSSETPAAGFGSGSGSGSDGSCG